MKNLKNHKADEDDCTIT